MDDLDLNFIYLDNEEESHKLLLDYTDYLFPFLNNNPILYAVIVESYLRWKNEE